MEEYETRVWCFTYFCLDLSYGPICVFHLDLSILCEISCNVMACCPKYKKPSMYSVQNSILISPRLRVLSKFILLKEYLSSVFYKFLSMSVSPSEQTSFLFMVFWEQRLKPGDSKTLTNLWIKRLQKCRRNTASAGQR